MFDLDEAAKRQMSSCVARATAGSFSVIPHAATCCPNADFAATEGFSHVAPLPERAITKYCPSPRKRVALNWPEVRWQQLSKQSNVHVVITPVENSYGASTMKQTGDLQKGTCHPMPQANAHPRSATWQTSACLRVIQLACTFVAAPPLSSLHGSANSPSLIVFAHSVIVAHV